MVKATKSLSNRIAVVFDFDDTLVPDTVDRLASSCGLDSKAFRRERIQPLIDSGKGCDSGKILLVYPGISATIR